MRLIRPYSDFVVAGAPFAGSTGFPGADNTTPFAWWIVAFNSVESKQLTAHA
jgi:hypothetical protein